MEIHKPKPWHGFREFFKEYLIIVVGVLTALAGEQAVEWLRLRQEVGVLEAELQQEVRTNLGWAYERVAFQPCQAERITNLLAGLRRSGVEWTGNPAPFTARNSVGYDPPVLPVVYGASFRPWLTAVWDSARASGMVDHLGHERAARYAAIYRITEVLRDQQAVEDRARPGLAPLAFDTKLDARDRNELIARLADLDQQNQRISGASTQLLMFADRQGLHLNRKEAEANVARWRQARACVRMPKVPLDDASPALKPL